MKQLQAWSIAVALGVAGAVTAQTQTPPESSQTPPESTQQPSPAPSTSPTEGTAADRTPPGQTATSESARTAAATGDAAMKHRASKLIGMKVQTYSGEPLGEIEDVVIDDTGRITHVIVDRSAVPGASGYVALPWTVAGTMIQGGNLVAERGRIEKAPTFNEQSWPDMSARTWSAETDRYWGSQGVTR